MQECIRNRSKLGVYEYFSSKSKVLQVASPIPQMAILLKTALTIVKEVSVVYGDTA